MNKTKFKLHEDPEEIVMLEDQVNSGGEGYFSMDDWLKLMTFKENNIEEDLVASYRVFDPDETGMVSKDELKSTFLSLLGRETTAEEINRMFADAKDWTDQGGNLHYEEFIKVMLQEPDPLATDNIPGYRGLNGSKKQAKQNI